MAPRGTARENKDRDAIKVKIDPVNEIAVLRAVCLSERARKKYASLLTPDYFLADGYGHPEMWRGIVELTRRGLDYSVDALTSIIGAEHAATLDGYVTPGEVQNLDYHVQNLRWDRARNEVASVLLPDFFEQLRDPTAQPSDVQLIARKMTKALEGSDLRYLRSIDSVADELEKELDERLAGRGVFPFGIPGLDMFGDDDFVERKIDGEMKRVPLKGTPRMIPGTAPGMVTLVTGESGSGKTVITANMVAGLVATKRRVLWGGWEQQAKLSAELVGEIMLSLSRSDMWGKTFTREDRDELIKTVRSLRTLKFMDNPFGRSDERGKFRGDMNDKNLNLLHEYISTSGCDVAIFDVFRDALEDSRPEEEIRAIRRMLGIAKETKTHLILIQHINLKTNEKRGGENARPTRGVVMGTGDWINKADNAIAMWADKDAKKIEVHVLKQRHGAWPLAVEFDCDFEFPVLENGRSIAVRTHGQEANDDLSAFLAPEAGAGETVVRKGRKRR